MAARLLVEKRSKKFHTNRSQKLAAKLPTYCVLCLSTRLQVSHLVVPSLSRFRPNHLCLDLFIFGLHSGSIDPAVLSIECSQCSNVSNLHFSVTSAAVCPQPHLCKLVRVLLASSKHVRSVAACPKKWLCHEVSQVVVS